MGVFTHGDPWQAQAQAVPEFWAVLPSTRSDLWVLSTSYHCWGPAGHRVSHHHPQMHCASREPLHPSSISSHLESSNSKNFCPSSARTCPSSVQHLTDPAMKHEQGGAWDDLDKHWVSKEDDFLDHASHHIAWGHKSPAGHLTKA